jgi:hypothetical protein
MGRFSKGANECLDLLREVRAQLVMPWVYINECASHLLQALNYDEGVADFEESLAYSQNGFVAQFYQLKKAGLPVPPSIRGFVETIAPDALRSGRDRHQVTQRTMSQIQPLLLHYGVHFDPMPNIAENFRKDIETAYVFKMRELRRRKSSLLIDHDVMTLSYMRQGISRNGEKRMCLTWDAAMIAVARELKDCGWVVSPHEASDIIQQRLTLSTGKLVALAHTLARAQERPSELGARIIDKVVVLAREKLQDWQFRERLKHFEKEALSRIEIGNDRYADTIDQETDKFLEQEGVGVRKHVAIEDADVSGEN